MDPPRLATLLISLLTVSDCPVGHDRSVVGSILLGKIPGTKGEIVLARDLARFNPEIPRVGGVAENVLRVTVFDKYALGEMLDKAAGQDLALMQRFLGPFALGFRERRRMAPRENGRSGRLAGPASATRATPVPMTASPS
jgi:hypothetical protein